MKSLIPAAFAAMVLSAIFSGDAQAQSSQVRALPQQGKFSVTPEIGSDVTIGGKFVEGASQAFAANGTISGITISAVATITAKDQSFDEVFDQPIVGGLRVNYGLNDKSEVFGGLRVIHASAKDFDAFTINAAVNVGNTAVTANGTFKGKFEDYNEQSLDVGYRQFFDVSNPFKPYVAGVASLRHINDMKFAYSFGGTEIDKFKFFDNSWSVGLGADVGFRYDIKENVAMGFEAGIRYEHNLKGDDSDLQDAGNLKNVNDAGNRWNIPLKATVTVQF